MIKQTKHPVLIAPKGNQIKEVNAKNAIKCTQDSET